MAGIFLPGSSKGGDITGVTAGVGLSGGGDSSGVTLTLDLSELSAVVPTSGDWFGTLDSDEANEQLTTTDALATLFAGDGLTASSAALSVNVDDSTIETDSDAIRIKDDGVTAAKLFNLARGSVLIGNASAATAELTIGNNTYVLTSDGTDIAWAAAGAGAVTALNNATENEIVTVGSTTTELDAESTLTFASSKLIPTPTAHDAAGTALTVSAGATTAATTDNIAGGTLTLQGGQGKGSGAGGDIVFQTANAAGSGSSLNSLATALTLSDDLSATFAGAVDLGSNTLTSTGSMQIRTIDYSDGDLSMTIADGGGVTFAQNIQTADIELGHASDTTISRSASGVVTIEGAKIKTAGTENIWVPAAAMTPRDNAGCSALTTVAAGTNGRPDFHVLDFDNSSDEHAQFTIAMPKSWDGGNVYYYVYWIGLAATTGVTWGLEVLSLNDNEEFDQAYVNPILVDDDSQGDVTELLVSAKSAAIACSGADNDLLCFQVYRDVSAGNDDMAGDARLWGLLLEYTTDAATDA
jgi:hypothetical protein